MWRGGPALVMMLLWCFTSRHSLWMFVRLKRLFNSSQYLSAFTGPPLPGYGQVLVLPKAYHNEHNTHNFHISHFINLTHVDNRGLVEVRFPESQLFTRRWGLSHVSEKLSSSTAVALVLAKSALPTVIKPAILNLYDSGVFPPHLAHHLATVCCGWTVLISTAGWSQEIKAVKHCVLPLRPHTKNGLVKWKR